MRAWLEIDLAAIVNNYQIVKKVAGRDVAVMAIVKSDAYGHGLGPIAELLDKQNVDMFGVNTLDEAHLVASKSDQPVLILGYLDQKELSEAIESNFILSLFDKELLPLIERTAQRLNRQARVHLKIDTGMNRLGLKTEEAIHFLSAQRLFPHIKVEGIFSHLAKATDPISDRKQLQRLHEVLVAIQGVGEVVPIHLNNSFGLAAFPEGNFDMVRIGLGLYGVEPLLSGLLPSLTCKAVIMQIKQIDTGDGVGYDHLFVAQKPTTIAVVALGYGEGYTQLLTGKAEAIVHGKRVPVIGKISMNMLTVEVTGLPVKRGEEVVLIGKQKGPDGSFGEITVAELAQKSGVRHHEILIRLGSSLPKLYYE